MWRSHKCQQEYQTRFQLEFYSNFMARILVIVHSLPGTWWLRQWSIRLCHPNPNQLSPISREREREREKRERKREKEREREIEKSKHAESKPPGPDATGWHPRPVRRPWRRDAPTRHSRFPHIISASKKEVEREEEEDKEEEEKEKEERKIQKWRKKMSDNWLVVVVKGPRRIHQLNADDCLRPLRDRDLSLRFLTTVHQHHISSSFQNPPPPPPPSPLTWDVLSEWPLSMSIVCVGNREGPSLPKSRSSKLNALHTWSPQALFRTLLTSADL